MRPEPLPRDVSADDVRFLLAVARAGRMTSAASLLGVDHTTVRRRLDRLETALRVRLLDRGADGWELTAVGREIVARAAPLEQLVEEVVRVASGEVDAIHGLVRVVAPEGFGAAFVVPALAGVQVEHPGISVELVTSTRPLSLRGSGFDLAVTVGSPAASRVDTEPLAPYALRLYAAPSYLASHPPIRTAEDLAGHALVFYVDALLSVRELDLAPLLGGMRVGFGSTSVFGQLEATRRGAGVGLLHAFMAGDDPGLREVLPGKVDFRLGFSLSARSAGQEGAAVTAVREALHREVRERGSELIPPH